MMSDSRRCGAVFRQESMAARGGAPAASGVDTPAAFMTR